MENPPPEFWQPTHTYNYLEETKVSIEDLSILRDKIHKVCTDEFADDYSNAIIDNPTAVIAMVSDWLDLYSRGYDRYVRKVEWVS
jgi:hypothetical protein